MRHYQFTIVINHHNILLYIYFFKNMSTPYTFSDYVIIMQNENKVLNDREKNSCKKKKDFD